jgi:hypothetical protein
MIPIDGTGYVVRPLDGVNGVRRNLLARTGWPGPILSLPKIASFNPLDLPDVLIFRIRVAAPRGRARATAPSPTPDQ